MFTLLGYGAVDFTSPVATLWVAAVLAFLAVVLFVHAAMRRRRHLKYSAQTKRNVDVNVLHDIKVERIVAWVLAFLAVVALAVAGWIAWQTHQNVRGNLAEKYGITEVSDEFWTGSHLQADVTYEDGSEEQGAWVYFEPDGEPLMGEDIYVEMAPGQ